MAGTLTVGCKLPTGIVLRVFDMVDHSEPVLGGGTKAVKIARQKPQTVKLKGSAVPFGTAPAHPIVGGYALTTGVDADLWALWLEQNKESDLVKNGIVFACPKPDVASDKARDQAEVRSGLEPIDPAKLPRGIQPGDKKAA